MFTYLLLFTLTMLGTCWAHHRLCGGSLGGVPDGRTVISERDRAVVSGSTEVSRRNAHLNHNLITFALSTERFTCKIY